MYTKVKIFNLALGALLLQKQVINVESDKSTEVRTLDIHYDSAFRTTISDLDLDGTSTQKDLELVKAKPNLLWDFAYKYPSNCAFFRRIQSPVVKDNRSNQIPRKVGTYNGQKVIFTNAETAIAEYIPNDLNLSILSDSAAMAVAYKLAWMSSPLITGKGALALKKDIQTSYLLAKAEAQEQDRLENATFDEDDITSEFVEVRTS